MTQAFRPTAASLFTMTPTDICVVGGAARGARVNGVGAPSPASTLISYVGLDEAIIAKVGEIFGPHKVGATCSERSYRSSTGQRSSRSSPSALLSSWHIPDELVRNLSQRGFKGKFILPLPTPRVVVG